MPRLEAEIEAEHGVQAKTQIQGNGRFAVRSAVAPNLLEQRFAAEAPDQAGKADLTHMATDDGWLG